MSNINRNDKVVFVGAPDSVRSAGHIGTTNYSTPDECLKIGGVYCVERVTMFKWGCRPHPIPALFIVGHRVIWDPTGEEVPRPAMFFRKVSDVQADKRAARKVQKSIGKLVPRTESEARQ